MFKRVVLLKLFLSFLLGNVSARGDELCTPSANEMSQQASSLWQTSCVATCSKIYSEKDSNKLKVFEKNCSTHVENNKQPYTFSGAARDTAKVFDQALLQCIPGAGVKAFVGIYEFAKALPTMIGYLLTAPEVKETASPSRSEWARTCAQSAECKRALARNTIRYRNITAEGQYQISDEELDKTISSTSFNEIHQQALHDLPMTQRECQTEIAQIRRQVSADGEDWNLERHQKVYDELSKKSPHCPPALGLLSPAIKPPAELATPESQEECFRREKEPMKCLGILDKAAVTSVCLGQAEYDKMVVDFCSEVTQYLIPIPFVGPQTKIVKAAVESGEAGARVARAAVVNGERTELAASAMKSAAAKTTMLSPAQRSFVSSYKDRVFVPEAQNSRYITMAESSTEAVTQNKARYFDVENSVMKKLNDKTNNKDLVTGITNFQKETLIKRLDDLEKKYPGIDFELYSDFKSVKIGMKSDKPIDAATHERLLKDLEKIYGESNAELVAKMKELNIDVAEAGDAKDWFKAGFGRSTDEAALAARQARQETGAGVYDFTRTDVKGKVESTIAHIEKQRSDLASSPQFKSLMEKGDNGVSLPSEEVFDLVRKTESSEKLAQSISKRYGISNFSVSDATKLQAYAKSVDELQPPILISKRELMSLDIANQGGATADFLGMGSANLRATAEGVAGKASVEDAIRGIRAGEKKVTRTFKERMDAFKKKVKDANCSGDDCETATAIATSEKIKVMNSLASDPKTQKIRMSFFAEGVAPETRRQIASHGESLEKAFRKEIESKIPHSKMRNLTIGFDMKSQNLNQGSVDMLIGKKPGMRFSAQEKREIQAAFARALESVGKEARGYSQGVTMTREMGFISVSPTAQMPRIFGVDEDSP